MTDFKVTPGDPIKADTWNSVVDRLPKEQTGYGAALANINRVMARIVNSVGQDLDVGDPVALSTYQGPSGNIYDVPAGLLFNGSGPSWPATIAEIGFAAEPIPSGQQGYAVVSGLALVKCSGYDGQKKFAMLEPEVSADFKVTTGGPVKIIADYDGSRVWAIVGEPQNLWRYKLREDLGEGSTAEADLLDLEGNVYAENITLKFDFNPTDCIKADTEGFCMCCGKDFYAIGSESAFMGSPSQQSLRVGSMTSSCDDGQYCFSQPELSAWVFTCDEEGAPPSTSTPVMCIDGKEFYDCTNLCDYICTYCDVFATDEICEPCAGVCVWRWETGINEWTLVSDDCTPENPDCGCLYPPSEPGQTDGEERTVDCSAEPAPPQCENCGDCPDQLLTLISASYYKTITPNPNADTIEWLITGNIQENGNCAFTAEIEWRATKAVGDPVPPGPVAATVNISYDGTAEQWSVVPSTGSPWSDDTGEFTILTPGGGCGVDVTEPGDHMDVIVVDDLPEAITVSLRVGTTPCTQVVSVSSIFKRDNADLLGCGCSRGVLAVMDRWRGVDPEKIDRVVQTLHNKNQQVSKAEIARRIRAAVEEWQNSLNPE